MEDKKCECGCGQIAPISTVNNKTYGYIKGEPMRFVHGHSLRGRNKIVKTDKIKKTRKKRAPEVIVNCITITEIITKIIYNWICPNCNVTRNLIKTPKNRIVCGQCGCSFHPKIHKSYA